MKALLDVAKPKSCTSLGAVPWTVQEGVSQQETGDVGAPPRGAAPDNCSSDPKPSGGRLWAGKGTENSVVTNV